MDYEKKYKEALGWMQSVYPTMTGSVKEDAEHYFPELQESDDEKIRKKLIHLVNKSNEYGGYALHKWEADEMLAWLEKQGNKDEEILVLKDQIESLHAAINALKEVHKIELEKQGEQKPADREFTFKAIPRLLEMIEPTNRAKTYCQKLIDTLIKEGYVIDAMIVGESLKQMNGEDVPMATMDEQKSINKVKPKFHEGAWITNGNYTWKIVEVKSLDYMLQSQDGNIVDDTISHVDEQFHSFTIQDAKDGDVLHSTGWHNDCIFIFNGLDNWKFDEPNGDRAIATGYCCLSVSADNMEFGIQGPDCVEVNTIKPATKIQRDLLYRKMHEAGYTFDFEKKELKKVEPRQEELTEFEKAVKQVLEEAIECGDTHNLKADADLLLRIARKTSWSEEQMDELENEYLKSIPKY